MIFEWLCWSIVYLPCLSSVCIACVLALLATLGDPVLKIACIIEGNWIFKATSADYFDWRMMQWEGLHRQHMYVIHYRMVNMDVGYGDIWFASVVFVLLSNNNNIRAHFDDAHQHDINTSWTPW